MSSSTTASQTGSKRLSSRSRPSTSALISTPTEAVVAAGFAQHLDGERRMVHRHVRDGGEPLRPLRDDLGEPFVLKPVGAQRLRLGQPVEVLGRRHREHLHVDALGIHVGQSLFGVLELRGVQRARAVLGVVARRLLRRIQRAGLELGAEERFGHRGSRFDGQMGVRVDAQPAMDAAPARFRCGAPARATSQPRSTYASARARPICSRLSGSSTTWLSSADRSAAR